MQKSGTEILRDLGSCLYCMETPFGIILSTNAVKWMYLVRHTAKFGNDKPLKGTGNMHIKHQ